MTAYVGMPVTYIPRLGRRETEMAALITAIYPDDRCDLIIFPPMGETYQQPKVPMLGDAFKTHVWMAPAVSAGSAGDGVTLRVDLRSAKPAARAKEVAA